MRGERFTSRADGRKLVEVLPFETEQRDCVHDRVLPEDEDGVAPIARAPHWMGWVLRSSHSRWVVLARGEFSRDEFSTSDDDHGVFGQLHFINVLVMQGTLHFSTGLWFARVRAASRSRCVLVVVHNSALQMLSLCRSSSTFGVPHTKLQQRCRACSWTGVHVEVRRACPVWEELAAGLTAAQGYGAPLRLGRPNE